MINARDFFLFAEWEECAIRNAKSLIGMPVILDGKRLGRALDIGMTQDLKQITGLYVDCGLRGSRFIPADQVKLMGEVAIFVNGNGKRTRMDGSSRLRRALSTDGRRLGAICGVLIDEEHISVEALELSHGYIDDLIGGRQYVRHYTAGSGGDVVIDTREEAVFTPTGGGEPS